MMRYVMDNYSSSMNTVLQPSIVDFVNPDPLLSSKFNSEECTTFLLNPSMASIPISSFFPVFITFPELFMVVDDIGR